MSGTNPLTTMNTTRCSNTTQTASYGDVAVHLGAGERTREATMAVTACRWKSTTAKQKVVLGSRTEPRSVRSTDLGNQGLPPVLGPTLCTCSHKTALICRALNTLLLISSHYICTMDESSKKTHTQPASAVTYLARPSRQYTEQVTVIRVLSAPTGHDFNHLNHRYHHIP